MNLLQSIRDYEEFVYTLPQSYPCIVGSTLVVVRRGKGAAVLRGELRFSGGYRLVVQERLALEGGALVMEAYGYEIWSRSGKIAWYDSQPHPGDPVLARTFPHHKHVPPDIKHNRLPVEYLSFTRPNLPVLIREVETLVNQEQVGKNS